MLVAVPPGPDFTTPVQHATFTEAEATDAAAWIDERRPTWKVYFAVNALRDSGARMPTRDDVAEVGWLHLDLPIGDEDADRAARRLLRDNLPPGFCGPPSVVVATGDFLHALWRIADPVRIGEGGQSAEDVDLYNAEIAAEFGGDAHKFAQILLGCNRILLLPGTKTHGRNSTTARVVWSEASNYPIASFKKAAKLQSPDHGGFGSEDAGAPAEVLRVESVGYLQALAKNNSAPLDAYVVDLIVGGYDPKDQRNATRNLPRQYARATDALFAVCCAMVKSSIPDDCAVAVITDPRFGISKSALDRAKPLQYAVNQVARAHKHVECPELLELNDRHAIISDMGGRCVVVTEIHDRGRRVISKQSFNNFRDRYVKRKIKVGEKTVGKKEDAIVLPVYENLGDWWLKHPGGNQYERVVFSPGSDVPGCYNLWQGFAVEAKPGDCSLYLAHVFDNVCSGNEEHYAYLLNWMARAVQRPAELGYTAIVIRGRQRTGKTFFGQWFGKLFGTHMWHIADADMLVGRFNAHLRDSVLVVADEAFYAADRKHGSKLKMLITQEEVPYEPKGVDAEMGPNFTHLIMSSDKDWVVPVGLDEQRFFILNIADNKINQPKYFEAIERQMLDGGLEALLDMLMKRDIAKFQVREVPQTEALVRQKLLSMSPEQEWWYLKLRDGAILPRHDSWCPRISADDLQRDYYAFAETSRLQYPAAPVRLGMFLSDICPGNYPVRQQQRVASEAAAAPGEKKFRRSWHYVFPPLEDCRHHFERHIGSAYEWPDFDQSESNDDDARQPALPMHEGEPEEVPF